MKPKLILHIGAPKCGSSTIQSFLSKNRDQLRSAGYLVPDEELGIHGEVSGHHVWFLHGFRSDTAAGKAEVRQRLLKLKSKLRGEGEQGIIISAENLSDSFGLHHLFVDLTEDFDFRIIVYIRRQDDFLLSSWQQWNVKKAKDFWAWLLRAIGGQRRGDWYHALEPWIRTFGAQVIIVRRFGRQYFHDGDLLSDFCASCGLPSGKLDLTVEQKNTGFNDTVVDFAFALQDLFTDGHDNDFYRMISHLGGTATQKSGNSSWLNHAQRNALLSHYAESNKRIKDLFFPGSDIPDSLFEPPKRKTGPDPRTSAVSPHSELLMRLLYGVYKELEAQRK